MLKISCKENQKLKDVKTLRSRKGITLIALVITIIVLLILAGVSIAMLTGDNGIINQANEAKEKTKLAEMRESVQLEILGALNKNGKINYDDAVWNLYKNLGAEASKNGDGLVVSLDGYEMLVDGEGKVSEPVKEVVATEVPIEQVTKNTKYSDGSNIVMIPKGFKVSNKEEEQKIDTD